ncbi:cytochrome P450 [Trifolium medium]|uniref:Cytochrome P450 n=1 Tax=Trifolium medium TaxID=97028 RepID=A0A392QJ04_9FABA|nr:cytochrome P450 [Trifolium medium]
MPPDLALRDKDNLDVCKPKNKGGLGVRDLRSVNLALLDKWRWRLLFEGQGTWRDILLARDVSHMGSRIDVSSDWFFEEVSMQVGNGKSTAFWFSCCVEAFL